MSPSGLRLGSLTSFVGREREITEAAELLRSGRLLTLTGAGGSGKTRLARAVAETVQAEFRDGVVWVPLATVTQAALVSRRVAEEVGVSEAGSSAGLEAVAAALEGRSLLLVLDDCEHLVEAVAGTAEELLRGCPELTVLATSREALGVPGERAWLVPPLSIPPEDPASVAELLDSEAAQLFLDRARDAVPSFEIDPENAGPVARICRRLDGIPLALELAAARVRVLAPSQIASRLDDAFRLLTGGRRTDLPRHRTLRATMDWSYELLSPAERLLLQRLSVFAGGCTLEAAEAVCSDTELSAGEVLERLAALVDRSMVGMRERGASARYGLLETVRLYATERLEESGDVASRRVRSRHAGHFLALAESAVPRLERLEHAPEVVAGFDVEQDNFRAALAWAVEEEPVVALRMAAALSWFWINAGRWREGARWLEVALAPEAADDGDPGARASALSGAGALAYLLHDIPRARAFYEEAAELWRVLSEPRERARTLAMLAQILAESEEGEAALVAAREAVETAREVGEGWVLAWTLACQGTVYRSLHRLEEAEEAYAGAEAAARMQEIPGAWLLEAPLGRALVAMLDGQTERAALHALVAVRLARSMARPWYMARTLLACAAVAARGGDAEKAARFLGGISAAHEEETPLLPHEHRLLEELSRTVGDALGEEAFAGARAAGAELASERALEGAEEFLESRATAAPVDASALSTGSPAGGRPPGLAVLALGPLEIQRNGLPLLDDAWQYAKPRELFLYLVCHPGGRTREQVGLAFWPEASAAQVKNNFHVALHRVRRVLGDAGSVVLDQDRYRLHPELEVAFDADRFEREVPPAVRALDEGQTDPAAVAALREALALYRGDFLEGEPVGDWAEERGDRLRRLFVRGQAALGEAHFREERFAEAVEAFERLILVEPLHEEACRRLMTCRARAGDRAGALRLYRRLHALLADELDAEPETETEELAERLRENRPI